MRANCKDCGISQGGHVRGCPRHPDALRFKKYTPLGLANKDYGPSPYEPSPDTYLPVWQTNAANERPIKTPVFEESPGYADGVHVLRQTGYSFQYPHQDWLEARERYAKDPERHPIDTVLMHVTETNPPYVKSLVCERPGQPVQPVARFNPMPYVLLIMVVCAIATCVGVILVL